MSAVYKRELKSYFNSMIGYVFIAVVMVFIGIYFMIVNMNVGFPYFASTLSSTLIIFVFAVPLLTMKSMAEERKAGTDQMLLTYPVSTTAVILGKYFAMMTVYAIPLAISCLCPIVILIGGVGSPLIDYSAILAFLCLGFLFVAIGMFISSLTESQIIAAVASMAVLLVLFLWKSLVNYIPTTPAATLIGFLVLLGIIVLALWHITKSRLVTGIVAAAGAVAAVVPYLVDRTLYDGLLQRVLGVFAIYDTISNFTSYYVFDIAGLLLYLSVAALFVFLTVQSVQKRRWS
ncbi:MAG: ABC transporter permease [Oscillospiraceae bacterium]|nr:ABC transporter permease [Oscillospiraceae bacterium]